MALRPASCCCWARCGLLELVVLQPEEHWQNQTAQSTTLLVQIFSLLGRLILINKSAEPYRVTACTIPGWTSA